MSNWIKQTVSVAAMATAMGTTVPAMADVFIKIAEIRGESVDAKHKGEVDALSWSWSTTTSRSIAGGGAATSKPQLQDLVITKLVDAASPQFMQFATTGRRMTEVILTVRVPGKSMNDFVRIKLKDVFVTGVKLTGAQSQAQPTEEISLGFQSIEFTVTPFSGGAGITTSYNAATGKS